VIPCTTKTVAHWMNVYKENGTVDVKRGGGRKRKTLATIDNEMVNVVLQNPFTTPREVKADLNVSVSHRTVRRRLNEAGVVGRKARKEFSYSPEHLRKRISFGSGYLNWTLDQWKSVIFSDECHVEMGEHGPVWVQRPVGTANEAPYLTTKVPHPKRVSIWGCFSWFGVGPIYVFTQTLNSIDEKDSQEAPDPYFEDVVPFWRLVVSTR